MKNENIVDISKLADEYIELLESWLSPTQMDDVRNNDLFCEHDFCDANMAAHTVFLNNGMDLDPGLDADADLWNAMTTAAALKLKQHHPQLGKPQIFEGENFNAGCELVGMDETYFEGAETEALYVYGINGCYLYIERLKSGDFFCMVMNHEIISNQVECERFLWKHMEAEVAAE